MAQPSVAREPSMEEILASIRRIIENNDVDAMKPAESAFAAGYGHADSYETNGHYDISDDDGAEAEVDDIRLTIEDRLPSFVPDRSPVDKTPPAAMTQSVRAAEAPAAPAPAAAREPVAPRAEPAALRSAVEPEGRMRPTESQQPRMFSHEPATRAPLTDPRPAAGDLRGAIQEEARSISLADVAARVRAASERPGADAVRHVAANQPAAGSRPVEMRPAPPVRAVEATVRPVQEVPVLRSEERERSIELRPPVTATEPRGVPAAENQQERPHPQEIAASPTPLPEHKREAMIEAAPREVMDHEEEQGRAIDLADAPMTDADDGKALVSASTGDQVARSFQDLAALVNNTPQRSLDEVAEELLRPMLQEWLDDNLPTLVERLVREEIERVARGPRR